MLTKDFYFDLPEELIAQEPRERDGKDRLLYLNKLTGKFSDDTFESILDHVEEETVFVVNDSKVRKARLFAKSESGAEVEFLFLRRISDDEWECSAKRSKRQHVGKRYYFPSGVEAVITAESDSGIKILKFDSDLKEEYFQENGHVPLPPYIKREDNFKDDKWYQTVYAKNMGSVAAPTAGLHFTDELLTRIESRFELYRVTLHVGMGTFLPVRSVNIEDHKMHSESFYIDPETMDSLNRAKRDKRRILAVGTTSMRTLESSSDESGRLIRSSGSTDIFIKPGYRFKFVDDLITNFHTPESTLLMLVSAMTGKESILSAYRHAIENGYRFFSYGDAMFINGYYPE